MKNNEPTDTYNEFRLTGIREIIDLVNSDSPQDTDDTYDEDRLRINFVQKIFASYSCQCIGLMDLHARVSCHSRPNEKEKEWISLHDQPKDLQHDMLIREAGQTGKPLRVISDKRENMCAIVLNVGKHPEHGERPGSGHLIALFDKETNAEKGLKRMNELCDELYEGLRLLRQTSNRRTVLSSSYKVSTYWEHAYLTRLANVIKNDMRSDGLRIHLVRHTSEGHFIEPLFGTDIEDNAARYSFSREKGLADWILSNNDWLLINQKALASGPDNGAVEALSGKKGRVKVFARQSDDFHPDRLIFIVPLSIDNIVTGVLYIWRQNTDHPYNLDTDLASLQFIAPRLAMFCRWPIYSDTVTRKADELTSISKIMASRNSPQNSLFHAIARGIGAIANAARTLMLLKAYRRNILFSVEDWTVGDTPDKEFNRWKFSVEHVGSPESLKEKLEHILPEIEGLLDINGKELILKDIFQIESEKVPGFIVLLDYKRQKHETMFHALFDDKVAEEMARSLLTEITPSLESHVYILAQRVIEEYTKLSNGDSTEPGDILNQMAKCLKNRTLCNAVLVYSKTSQGFEVQTMWPDIQEKINLPVAESYLTRTVINNQKPILITDVNDKNDPLYEKINHNSLRKIADAYGWKDIRSWACIPVISEGRCVGMFKLLTSREGIYMGDCHMKLVKLAAGRAGSEILQISRRFILRKINELSYSLAGRRGAELANEMIKGLKQLFVQLNCQIAVVANIHSTYPKAFATSPGIDDKSKKRLEKLSRDLKEKSQGNVGKLHYISAPVKIPGNSALSGSLFVLGDGQFGDHDIFITDEAAREISILLDYENSRYVWPRMVGRFRHAVIGPVQGLVSAARMLHSLAQSGSGKPEELQELKVWVEEEAEAIRLWRENQRIYMTEKVKVVRKTQDLKPVIDKCFDRFRELFHARGIKMELEWKVKKSSIPFMFDRDAIDIIMSNILDNALKYSFYNRMLTIGVDIVNNLVKIWVENQGHPIPEDISDSIYEIGERIDWVDPIRTIRGTGFGLPMAKVLTEAHNGRIYHSSKPLGQAREENIQPHQVRFTVELPYKWV